MVLLSSGGDKLNAKVAVDSSASNSLHAYLGYPSIGSHNMSLSGRVLA